MTGSRAALAAEGVALVFALMLRGRRWLWLPGGVVGATLALAIVWPHSCRWLVGLLLRDETVDTKMIARLDIWVSALRGIVDHPYSGIGLGVFNEVIPTRYPYQTVGLSYSVSQAHNVFLDTALGIGLPGLAGLLLLLLGMVMLAWKGHRHRRKLHPGAGSAHRLGHRLCHIRNHRLVQPLDAVELAALAMGRICGPSRERYLSRRLSLLPNAFATPQPRLLSLDRRGLSVSTR